MRRSVCEVACIRFFFSVSMFTRKDTEPKKYVFYRIHKSNGDFLEGNWRHLLSGQTRFPLPINLLFVAISSSYFCEITIISFVGNGINKGGVLWQVMALP